MARAFSALSRWVVMNFLQRAQYLDFGYNWPSQTMHSVYFLILASNGATFLGGSGADKSSRFQSQQSKATRSLWNGMFFCQRSARAGIIFMNSGPVKAFFIELQRRQHMTNGFSVGIQWSKVA
jgi:hypothetical protein